MNEQPQNAEAGEADDPGRIGEEQAEAIARCALALDQAKPSMGADDETLRKAVRDNADLWGRIRTYAGGDDCPLSQSMRDNLLRLADYVDRLSRTETPAEKDVESLIGINLQICEGLLEGVEAVRLRARLSSGG